MYLEERACSSRQKGRVPSHVEHLKDVVTCDDGLETDLLPEVAGSLVSHEARLVDFKILKDFRSCKEVGELVGVSELTRQGLSQQQCRVLWAVGTWPSSPESLLHCCLLDYASAVCSTSRSLTSL